MVYEPLSHTPRTSFVLTSRLWKHNPCSVLLFQERNWERLLEPIWISLCVSVHKSTTWNQNIDRSARIHLRSVTSGSIVCYPMTATSRFWMCHTICWMVLCQAFLSFLSLPPPPSKISSPLASPLGRPDTQANVAFQCCSTVASLLNR